MAVMMAAVMGMGLSSCSKGDADKKVETFVNKINDETAKKMVESNPFFDSIEARQEDGMVVIEMKAVEGMTFANVPKTIVEQQRQGVIDNYKHGAISDKVLREGLEGMRDKDMILRVKMTDTKGESIDLDVNPSEVLPAE